MRLAVALVLVALTPGCMSLVTGGPLIREGEPTGFIEVVNDSAGGLDVVLISSCRASSYGLNRLPRGTSIPRGSSYRFEVSAGCWDVAAGAVGVGDARERMEVGAGQTTRYTVYE